MISNWTRGREATPEDIPPLRFRSESCRRLLCSPARNLLPKQFAKFGYSPVGIREMLKHARFRAALRFEDRAILLDHSPVLLLPEGLVKKTPVGPLPSAQFTVSEEVHQCRVIMNRCGETKDPQNTFRPERQRDIQPHPKRITAIKLRPIEIHTTLAFTLDDESIRVAL